MKHTPGPWKVLAGTLIEQDKPNGAVYIGHVQELPHFEMRANARLIAAAPDLLDACELILKEMERAQIANNWDDSLGVMKARAAIAKIKDEA